MKLPFPPLASPRLKKSFIAAAVLLAVFAVTGFFIVPPIARPILENKLSEGLHRAVSIKKIKINPFALSATVTGVEVKGLRQAENFASFDELYVNLEIASLFKRGTVIREVRLVRPYINIVRNNDTSYNFSDLVTPKAAKKSEPMRFSVNNIQILGGAADFVDGPKNTTHTVRDVNITIPFVSNLGYYEETFVQPSLSAVVNDAPISFKGESKPFSDSLETSFDIDLKGLDIPYYLAYAPFKMNFSIPSGMLDAQMKASYKQFKGGKAPELNIVGDLSLRKFRVNDKGGSSMLDIPRLDISIASTELLTKKIHFAGVTVGSPGIDLVRDNRGKINLLSLLPESKGQPPAEEKKGGPPLSLDVDMVKVSGGRVSFSDHEGGKAFRAVLKPVDLLVTNFSTVKDWSTSLDLSIVTDAAETVKVTGGIRLAPLRFDGTVAVGNVPLNRYAPYYRDKVTFDVEDGILGLSTGVKYSADKDAPETRVFDMSVSLSSVRLRRRVEKSAFLTVPKFRLDGTGIDLVRRQAVVGSIYTEGGSVNVIRDKEGVMNLLKLVEQGPAGGEKPARRGQTREKGWAVLIKGADAVSWTVRMEDNWPPETAVLIADRLNVKARDIDTAPGAKGMLSMSFRPNKKGSFEASGTIGVNPVSVEMRTRLKNVEVTSMQPYFSDKVKVLITDGRISTAGSILVGFTPAKGYRVRYAGDISVDAFAAVDKLNGDDFIKWESLSIAGMAIGYNPILVDAKSVTLSGLYSRLIINQDGTLNVLSVTKRETDEQAMPEAGTPQPSPGSAPAQPAQLAQQEQPAQPEQPEKKPAYTARVGTITLKGGRINFTDRRIKPSYSVDITEVNGSVSGLSSDETKLGALELKAMFGNYAPIDISGSMNPLRKDLYVDIKTRLTGLDLSQFTPYSGKYAGYTVEKGKLSLDLQYLVDKNKLEAKNNIFADQFYMGEKVESPDATKLPVKLALALLRDRHGEIHLDVPLSGSIDDPKFSLGKIVIQVIVNIISKAVTSPFALLGGLFGGGEDLGYVEFDYGEAAVGPDNSKKLDTLASAMYERPSLKLNIEGHADTKNDAVALRQSVFQNKVKAQKLKDMVSEGQPAVPVADVKVAPEEYEKYLKQAYKAEKFPKPRNIIGIAKSLPVAEMEKLMLANIEVTEDDLRQLAADRAETVRKYILGTAKVEPERVFVVQPKALAPEKQEGLKDSRVVFLLE